MPTYPETIINEKKYYKTIDPNVFIESMEGIGDDAVFIYVDFAGERRWKQTGDCYSCGILDASSRDENGNPILPEHIILQPEKKLGERYSVIDTTYETRLDVVNGPSYVEDAKAEAAELGVEYQCGITIEVLPWIE